jgi:hypothetical protein
VVLSIEPPTQSWFAEVAKHKFGNDSGTFYTDVAKRIMELRGAAEAAGLRPPGTGEFLDAILACRKLDVNERSEMFEAITLAASWKQPEVTSSAQADPEW